MERQVDWKTNRGKNNWKIDRGKDRQIERQTYGKTGRGKIQMSIPTCRQVESKQIGR
jgi:hypothetical protein